MTFISLWPKRPLESAVGAKGVAELALVGVAAAVANALYHATGIRVRDLPITPEKLLSPNPSPAHVA